MIIIGFWRNHHSLDTLKTIIIINRGKRSPTINYGYRTVSKHRVQGRTREVNRRNKKIAWTNHNSQVRCRQVSLCNSPTLQVPDCGIVVLKALGIKLDGDVVHIIILYCHSLFNCFFSPWPTIPCALE